MKLHGKYVLIGILYLLWNFSVEVELLHAGGKPPYQVDERITATRRYESYSPYGGSGRNKPNYGAIIIRSLPGVIHEAGRIMRPEAYPEYGRRYPARQPVVIVNVPQRSPYPRYPQSSSQQYGQYGSDGIYIQGSGDAVDTIKRSLISMGKTVTLNRQYASVEMKVTQKRVGNEVQVYIDVIDVMNQTLIDSQIGRGVMTANSQEAQFQAAQMAVQDAMSRLTI